MPSAAVAALTLRCRERRSITSTTNTTEKGRRMTVRLFDADAGASGAKSARLADVSKGLVRLLLAAISVLAFALAVAPSASAGLKRDHQTSFPTSFTGQNPVALTVDQQNGDIYAVNTAAGTVARFDSTGAAKNFTAGADTGTNTLTGFSFDGPSATEVAIDRSGGLTDGDIYVTDSFGAGIKVFNNDGSAAATLNGSSTPNSAYSEACGVAVNQSNGDVYVGDYGARVWRYSPSGADVAEADYSGGINPGFNPCQVAADAGDVYAAGFDSTGPLRRYAASDFAAGPGATPTFAPIASTATAVATDPSTGDVYVDEGGDVAVFSPAGTALYSFGAGDFGTNSAGVAVRGGGSAYAADPAAQEIDVFSPSVFQAIATTDSATQVKKLRATLNAHLDPDGGPPITDCHFEWGATAAYGNTAPCAEGNSFSAPAPVSANLTGLTPGDTYHFRLHITTVVDDFTGADQDFTTASLPFTRPATGAFGPDGTSGTSFDRLDGLAFQQATHRLYALTQSETASSPSAVYGFDASGTSAHPPLSGFSPLVAPATSGVGGLAVDNTAQPSAGNLYLSRESADASTLEGAVYGFDSAGASLGGAFPIDPAINPGSPDGDPKGICADAIDSAGNLWVANYGTHRILRYDAAGAFQSSVPIPQDGLPCYLAFDSGDDLYVGMFDGPVWRYTAAGAYASGTEIDAGHTAGIAVDPSTDHLFVAHSSRLTPGAPDDVAEYDPAGDPLTVFADEIAGAEYRGITVDGASDSVYVSDFGNGKIRVFGLRGIRPDVTTGSASPTSFTSADLDGDVNPNGVPLTDCHFEYVTDSAFLTAGFNDLSSGGTIPCDQSPGSIASDFEDHPVTATVTGLDPAASYRFRLVAANAQAHGEGAASPISGSPVVETTGSPARTATTARLDSRVNPNGAPTSYHFEYGTTGSYGQTTPSHPIGTGNDIEFVSQQITGLQPATTYHYRVIAEQANPGGPVAGHDRTFTTRTSDAPLTHGNFPGPPASDRAWEQVSAPDTTGNAANTASAIADDGNSVAYDIPGGAPDSTSGSLNNYLLSERTATGWHNKALLPPRSQAPGNEWLYLQGRSDLSKLVAANSVYGLPGDKAIWNVTPGGAAQKLDSFPGTDWREFTATSDDASRTVTAIAGTHDPAHPVPPYPGPSVFLPAQLYDISDGSPHLVDLLPDGSVPACGLDYEFTPSGFYTRRSPHYVSGDGRYVFFMTQGDGPCNSFDPPSLYVRDLVDNVSSLISGSPVSGPTCGANFIRSTADATFFQTQSRLATDDTAVATCSTGNSPQNSDVYRYDLTTGERQCVTCVVPGVSANVNPAPFVAADRVAVSDDGSRVYFDNLRAPGDPPLVPGAPTGLGLYRVDVATGDLAFVAPGATAGDNAENAISPDGSVFVFTASSPDLDSHNGPQNGGTAQYYLYDDGDRSLVCVSCPADGTPPRADVPQRLMTETHSLGPNTNPISKSGDLVFTTPTPLTAGDQNTAAPGRAPIAGFDVYEWRDGAAHLITDGTTRTPASEAGGGLRPDAAGITPSGDDIFFTSSAKLTSDVRDHSQHLYDARIGGGFDFADATPPCALEACQGAPSSPPTDPASGSSGFTGPGNEAKNRSGKLTVAQVSKTARGFTAVLKVKVTGKGRLDISGSGLVTSRHSVAKASTVTVRVSLTAASRRQLVRRRKLVRTARVSFTPAGAKATKTQVALTFLAPSSKKGR